MAELTHSPYSTSYALAIDIGGTKIALAFIDQNGSQLSNIEQQPVPFDANGVADPKKIVAIIGAHVERIGSYPGQFMGVGISLCGNVDMGTGMAVLTPNLNWRNVPLGDMAADAFGLPIFMATDVRMAALAEVVWGKAKGVQNFAWATVGTGYGGYLFLDGKLYNGTRGFAGNFGHVTWDETGELCGCGKRGCFETFVAGPAIARAGQKAAKRGESPFLESIWRERPVTSKDVFEGEASGDSVSHDIIETVIRLIAINLGGLVNILDLELIILGGGVTHGAPDFVDRVSKRIRGYLMMDEAANDLIVAKESFENSALIGTAADVFLRQGVLSDKN